MCVPYLLQLSIGCVMHYTVCFNYYHKSCQHGKVRCVNLILIHVELRIILAMERWHIFRTVLPYSQSALYNILIPCWHYTKEWVVNKPSTCSPESIFLVRCLPVSYPQFWIGNSHARVPVSFFNQLYRTFCFASRDRGSHHTHRVFRWWFLTFFCYWCCTASQTRPILIVT